MMNCEVVCNVYIYIIVSKMINSCVYILSLGEFLENKFI